MILPKHDQDIWSPGRQTHLRLKNAIVTLVACAETKSLNRPAVARPMKAPTRTAKFVKPETNSIESCLTGSGYLPTDALIAPVIGRRSKCLCLGEIEGEKTTAAPADHKAGKFNDWERE